MKHFLKTILILFLTISFTVEKKVPKTERFHEKSETIVDSIFSKHLGEYRTHSVYLPRGFTNSNQYPIIYATDGGSGITELGDVLDSLIDNNIIQPIIFVASYSNNKIADSTSTIRGDGSKVYYGFRNYEYVDRSLMNKDTTLTNLFPKHLTYFSEELIPYIEKEFNQNLTKSDRYFYGVSNGAGFGIHLLNSCPDLIGTYICLSTFGGDVQSKTWKKEVKYPKLFWRHGSEETFLRESAKFMKSTFKKMKLFIEVKEYKGGHNNAYWRKEFIEIISSLLK